MSDRPSIYNPSLREVPRYQTAEVIPTQRDLSPFDWLVANGRLIPREDVVEEDPSEEEIEELMGAENNDYDRDNSDDDNSEA